MLILRDKDGHQCYGGEGYHNCIEEEITTGYRKSKRNLGKGQMKSVVITVTPLVNTSPLTKFFIIADRMLKLHAKPSQSCGSTAIQLTLYPGQGLSHYSYVGVIPLKQYF